VNNQKDAIENNSTSKYTEDENRSMVNTAEDFMNYFGNKKFETLTSDIPMTKAMKDFFLSKSVETIHNKIIKGRMKSRPALISPGSAPAGFQLINIRYMPGGIITASRSKSKIVINSNTCGQKKKYYSH